MKNDIRDIHYMDARFENQKAQLARDVSKKNFKDWNTYESWQVGRHRKLPTILKHMGAFKRVMRVYPSDNMKDLSANELIELNRKIVESKYLTGTKIAMQLFIRSYLNLLADEARTKEVNSLIKIMPNVRDDNPDSDEYGKVVSYSDFKKIYKNMPNPALGMMTKVLFSTGMRVTELYNIIPENIQYVKRKLFGIELPPRLFGYKCAWIYTRGKRTKSKSDGKYLYYIALYVDEFKKYIDKLDQDEYVFNYSYSHFLQCLHAAVKLAGLDYRIHPHMFRHTAATRLFKVHSDAVVKKIMNWSKNSNMPAHYAHINKSDIVEAMDKVKRY